MDDPIRHVIREEIVSITEREVSFRRLSRFVGTLVYGSWGVMLSIPLTLFAVSGEIRRWALFLPLLLLGYGLLYLAVRAALNRPRLLLEDDAVVFERTPLWPHFRRRLSFAEISAVRAGERPISVFEPERYRGHLIPRAWTLFFTCAGHEVQLPLRLMPEAAEQLRELLHARLGRPQAPKT